MNIYQIGTGGYLGATREIADKAGCPAGWTRTAPPPVQPGNYVVWSGTGWTVTATPYTPPESGPEVEPVPETITPRQCRLQLLAEGYLDDVEAAIGTMPRAAQIEWEYALEIKRDYELVTAIQALLSKDDEEMDTFFTEAAKL